jgi:hypothetical protein
MEATAGMKATTGPPTQKPTSKSGSREAVKLVTAWREATAAETIGTSQRQQQKGAQHNSTSISRDANITT